MTMLHKDRNTEYSLGDLLAIPVVGGMKIFAGSLICSKPDGFALPAGDEEGLVFEGVAAEECDNRHGADGDDQVIVRRRGRYRFDCETPLDQSAMSAVVHIRDDHTVVADESSQYGIVCGVIDKVAGDHDCWISIDMAVLQGRRFQAPENGQADG